MKVVWSKINGGRYTEFYQKEPAERENQQIKAALVRVIREMDLVFDYGCGAGLGERLFRDVRPEADFTWIGIDYDGGFNPLLVEDARKFPKQVGAVTVCLFAAEEIGVFNIARRVKTSPAAVIVFYWNAPTSGTSYYSGKWWRWFWTVSWKSLILWFLLKIQRLKIVNLAGGTAYKMATKERQI